MKIEIYGKMWKMWKISVIVLFVQIWILVSVRIAKAQPNEELKEISSPIININGSDITFEKGSSESIECSGEEPVVWDSEIFRGLLGNMVTTLKPSYKNANGMYTSKLMIPDVSHFVVGKFFCVFEKAYDENESDGYYEKEVKKGRASSIYIYVHDPEHPLVPIDDVGIITTQFQETLIPCKPSYKSVELELLNSSEEPIDFDGYDPQKGFTKKFQDLDESDHYICRVKDSEVHEYFNVMVHEMEYSIHGALSYLINVNLSSPTHFYSMAGHPLILRCMIVTRKDMKIHVDFVLPNNELASKQSYVEISDLAHDPHPTSDTEDVSYISMTINNTVKERDDGYYTCLVQDYHSKDFNDKQKVNIIDSHFIELYEDTGKTAISVKAKTKGARINIGFTAYPMPTSFIWTNNRGEQISDNERVMNPKKYGVEKNDRHVVLTIKNPELKDFGNYTLTASNDFGSNFTSVKLLVQDKPNVTVTGDFILPGEEAVIRCESIGYPPSKLSWEFRQCDNIEDWSSCDPTKDTVKFSTNDSTDRILSDLKQESVIKFKPSSPGFATCYAKNSMGSNFHSDGIMIGDFSESFALVGISPTDIVAVGDSLELVCAAAKYNYSSGIEWLKNDEPIDPENLHPGFTIETVDGKFSYQSRLIKTDLTEDDSGNYACNVRSLQNEPQMLEQDLTVHPTIEPTINPNFNQTELHLMLGEPLRLECKVIGIPIPTVTWYKDSELFVLNENNSQIIIHDDNSTIDFKFLTQEDMGTYRCEAINRVGHSAVEVYVDIKNKPILSKPLILIILASILFLILLSFYLCYKVKKSRNVIRELRKAGLAHFEEGNVDNIDWDEPIDEQADLLPYDKKYEFPREKLKLGKQLGAGAFGVVVKATAEGILPYEEETTVAVKMVKKQTDNEVMRALVSELKIMIHLGQHLNVVNLLGAVTKTIAQREMMVIVEYCKFGNLQTFLVKHRPFFIDQIVKDTDKIDPNIQINELKWLTHPSYNYNSDGNPYTSHPTTIANPAAHMNSQGYVRHSGIQHVAVDSCNTEATLLTGGEESVLLSNNSDQPLWRSNYGMDYKGPARTVNTSDLVCWGFQVARGMEYLSSRKILHGDLAARNILLCENNVVKICDFGLARTMYKTDNYKKKSEAPLPFKWLALEAISDHVFSTYSDIWAFGIVLWELFSLGKVPYTGMEANENLYFKLRDGYRMEKPQYSTQDIYDIMLSCWHAKPESRPPFNDLARKLGGMMEDGVKDHYVDLNEPYMQSNIENHPEGYTDYLALMGCPDSPAPKPPELPLYVNATIDMLNSNSDNSPHKYVSMSPKSGTVRYNSNNPSGKASLAQPEEEDSDLLADDSPTLKRNLDTSPKHKNKYDINKSDLAEQIPMLPRGANGIVQHSDSESDNYPKPMERKSLRKKREKEDVEAPEYTNIIDPTNTYVNVPSNIGSNPFSPDQKDAFSNPSYVTFDTVNER